MRGECGIERTFRQGPAQSQPSRSLDRGAKARQRLLELFVGNFRQIGGNARGLRRIDCGCFRGRGAAQRGLPQRDPLDRAPAEKAVHPFADDAGKMLNLDRRRSLDAQDQRTGRPRAGLVAARPLNLDRLAMRGDLGAGDFGPPRHQFGRGKALPMESLADHLAQQVAQRFGERTGGLVHCLLLCHASGKAETDMTVAAKAAKRQQAHGESPASCPQPTALLGWYDRHRRTLPWRAAPGERSDPYRVWLSEIMLQQTTVRAVAPYYQRFLTRWPDVQALAAAPLDDVLRTWAGLGYYARARNLHACARAVVERHAGQFPAGENELRALPGIGAYTAAAIAAIAFDAPASPVDGNIERVVARLFAVTALLPAAKPELRRLARQLTPRYRAGDFAQAMMDLGATICTPKNPACALCPWNDACVARARGDAATLPRRIAKREGALRRGVAFVVRRADDRLLVRTRPAKGLLGGMTEVPTTEWSKDFAEVHALEPAPCFAGRKPVAWRRKAGVVRHVFTHFPLELSVYAADVPARTKAPAGTRWVPIAELAGEALPTLMRKVIAHALDRATLAMRPSRRAPARAARRSQ